VPVVMFILGSVAGGFAGSSVRSRVLAARNVNYRTRLILARGKSGFGPGLPNTKFPERARRPDLQDDRCIVCR